MQNRRNDYHFEALFLALSESSIVLTEKVLILQSLTAYWHRGLHLFNSITYF